VCVCLSVCVCVCVSVRLCVCAQASPVQDHFACVREIDPISPCSKMPTSSANAKKVSPLPLKFRTSLRLLLLCAVPCVLIIGGLITMENPTPDRYFGHALRAPGFIRSRRLTRDWFWQMCRSRLGQHFDLDECNICMNHVFTRLETSATLPCSHRFHPHCLGSWLPRSQTCPTCRGPARPWRLNNSLLPSLSFGLVWAILLSLAFESRVLLAFLALLMILVDIAASISTLVFT